MRRQTKTSDWRSSFLDRIERLNRENLEHCSQALDVLEQDGCDVQELSRRLLMLEHYKRGRARSPLGKFLASDHKKIRTLPAKLRRCAALMAREEFGRFMLDAVMLGPASPASRDLLDTMNREGLLPLATEQGRRTFFGKFPEWMLEIAETIEQYISRSRFVEVDSFRNLVAWIAQHVRLQTGREHFAELSELLDAVLRSLGRPDLPQLGQDGLRQLVYREKQRQKRLLARRRAVSPR